MNLLLYAIVVIIVITLKKACGSPCDSNPCQNAGICLPTVFNGNDVYVCACDTGWHGLNCARTCDGNITSTPTDPCLHGGSCSTKHDNGDGTCICDQGSAIGWTGIDCSKPSFCGTVNPCANNNVCNEVRTGTDRVPIDPFVFRAWCGIEITPNSRIYTCRSTITFVIDGNRGRYCNHTAFCDAFPVLNGGTCIEPDYSLVGGSATDAAVSAVGTYNCAPGFTGSRCADSICASNPCHNAGVCELICTETPPPPPPPPPPCCDGNCCDGICCGAPP